MAYIGSTPTSQNFISGTDYLSGTGSQTAFTLTRTVNSVNDIEVVINNVVQQPSTAYTLSGTTITFTSAPSAGTNNIYVRYLATNMQSFTVPANSITRTQLGSNLQATISGRNKIINGCMRVDQRNAGASVTPTTFTYTLDRWYADCTVASKYSVQQNAGSVTPPVGFTKYLGATSLAATTPSAGDFYTIGQVIEGLNITDLGWGTSNAKTVTISFQVYSSLTGTFGAVLNNSGGSRAYPFTFSIPVANTWTPISVTIAGDTSGTWLTTNGAGIEVKFSLGVGSTYAGTAGAWTGSNKFGVSGQVNVVGTSGATFYITGVQLEEGTTANAFDCRQYGTELALCQRYYAKLTSGTSAYTAFGSGIAYATNAGTMFIKYPTTMRATPSINTSGCGLQDGVNIYSITAGTASYAGPDSAMQQFTVAGTPLTQFRPYLITGNNSTSAYLDLASEL